MTSQKVLRPAIVQSLGGGGRVHVHQIFDYVKQHVALDQDDYQDHRHDSGYPSWKRNVHVILAEYIAAGNDPTAFLNCQVHFWRGRAWGTARFEGIQEGLAVIRYNSLQEGSWMLPIRLDPAEVRIVLWDGEPAPYEYRPLTRHQSKTYHDLGDLQ